VITSLRSAVAVLLGLTVLASCGLTATDVDTTRVREPVAPKRSVGQTVLYAPVLIVKVPLKLLKGTAKVGLKLGLEQSGPRIFIQKVFGTNRPLHPLISYGSKSSVEGGIGFRLRNVFSVDDQIRATTWYSVNKYQRYRARYEGPSLLGENAGFTLRAEYNRRPRESFYGPGNDSHEDDEVSITRESGRLEGELSWRPCECVAALVTGSYVSHNLYDGEETALLTDLDMIRDTLRLAGSAFRSSRLITFGAQFQFDWRDHKGRPTGGGTQYLSLAISRGTGISNGFVFWQARADLRQYFHLFRKRILTARILVHSLDVLSDAYDIGFPAYLLPTLGGENDLRGYKPNRFWGRGLAMVSLEYRYPVWQTGDAFLFIDEGRVFHSFDKDFSWRDWQYSFGIGIRGWGDAGEKFRLTAAWSKEEVRFYLNLGQDL